MEQLLDLELKYRKIIVNGAPYRESNETAGEFSSILSNFKNPNNKKRFNKIRGNKNLIDEYDDKKKCAINSYELFENYRTGDETAKEVIRIMQNNCSRNCNHTLVLDTEKFCISGGISA